MTNFEFADALTIDTFPTHNDYYYGSLIESEMKFFKDSENLPYIIKALGGKSSKLTIVYSEYLGQFRGRALTTKKIKEIMNTSRYPLAIKLKDNYYNIGKGFLSRKNRLGRIIDSELLFVACVDDRKSIHNDMSEVKFFISRKVYLEENKPILPAIKDFMNAHTGDVIITNDIRRYVGDTIKTPVGGTLAQQKKYKEAVVLECLGDVLKKGK